MHYFSGKDSLEEETFGDVSVDGRMNNKLSHET
jgi:hypothetical protein